MYEHLRDIVMALGNLSGDPKTWDPALRVPKNPCPGWGVARWCARFLGPKFDELAPDAATKDAGPANIPRKPYMVLPISVYILYY